MPDALKLHADSFVAIASLPSSDLAASRAARLDAVLVFANIGPLDRHQANPQTHSLPLEAYAGGGTTSGLALLVLIVTRSIVLPSLGHRCSTRNPSNAAFEYTVHAFCMGCRKLRPGFRLPSPATPRQLRRAATARSPVPFPIPHVMPPLLAGLGAPNAPLPVGSSQAYAAERKAECARVGLSLCSPTVDSVSARSAALNRCHAPLGATGCLPGDACSSVCVPGPPHHRLEPEDRVDQLLPTRSSQLIARISYDYPLFASFVFSGAHSCICAPDASGGQQFGLSVGGPAFDGAHTSCSLAVCRL